MDHFFSSIKFSIGVTIIYGILCIIPYIFKLNNFKKNIKCELFKIIAFFILYSIFNYFIMDIKL